MKRISFLVFISGLLILSASNCGASESAVQTAIASTAVYEEGIRQETQAQADVFMEQTAVVKQTEQANIDLTRTAEALSVSQTQTAIPRSCTPGGTYIDGAGDTLVGYMDILQVETIFNNENLTVIFTLAELPDEITINSQPEGYGEYYWGVEIDVDQNTETGTTGQMGITGRAGVDYDMSLFHFSWGDEKTGPIENVMGYDASVWVPSSDGMGMESGGRAKIAVDYELNTISITGRIPGINQNSLLFFNTQTDMREDSLCE
jgi:hypothetical protein